MKNKFGGTGKRVLATLLATYVTRDKTQAMHLRWVRGHRGVVGNVVADRLAECGTRLVLFVSLT